MNTRLKQKPCPRCGTPFAHAYRKFCSWQCSLEDAYERGHAKGREYAQSQTTRGMNDAAELRGYNTAAAVYQKRVEELQREIADLRAVIVRLQMMQRAQPREETMTVGVLTVTLWRSLVHMAHPDRWNGTPLESHANDATRWLLAHRPKGAGR